MDTSQRIRVARILILFELVLAVTSFIEASVFVAVGLSLPGSALLTLGHVVLLAVAARCLARGGPTWPARVLQILVLTSAVIDLVVAALVEMQPLPVVVGVRILVPVVVLLLLRGDRSARRVRAVPADAAVSA